VLRAQGPAEAWRGAFVYASGRCYVRQRRHRYGGWAFGSSLKNYFALHPQDLYKDFESLDSAQKVRIIR
jgi:hypothetical protein